MGKHGVIRDPKVQLDVLKSLYNFGVEQGCPWQNLTYSPVLESEGNIEFLAHWAVGRHPLDEAVFGRSSGWRIQATKEKGGKHMAVGLIPNPNKQESMAMAVQLLTQLEEAGEEVWVEGAAAARLERENHPFPLLGG